jgi:predicted kinase
MSKLLMLKGLPASGKSTYAKELVDQGWKRVNKDDLRSMVDGGKWSKGNEKKIMEVQTSLIISFLSKGYNVVVDNTNFGWEDRLKAIADMCGAEFEVKYFDTSLTECIDRDAKRDEKSVGAEVIERMWTQYVKPPLQEYNKDLPSCYIFDIDGTLAKMNGRSPYDYTKVDTDIVNRDVAKLASILKNVASIIIVSGRNGDCIAETENWLDDNNIKYDDIFMRLSGDKRKDCIVKKELYEEHIKGKYNVLGVFDDRNQVVELWRSLGLTCFQVDYGNF